MSAPLRGLAPLAAIRRLWRGALASIPMAAILAATTAATPVLADCVSLNAAFPPGNWSGRVANLSTQSIDDLSIAVTDGYGAFTLGVTNEGEVFGTFTFEGTGEAASQLEGDESSSSARFRFQAEAGGSPTLVTLDGEARMAVETTIDVHHQAGEDPFSGSGQDLYGAAFDNTAAWASELEPRTQDCVSVSGEMTAPLGFDTDTVSWYAVRTNGRAMQRIANMEEQLVNLLDQAERVVNMDPFDSWVFNQFLMDMLRFDGLLNSLEGCNPDNVATFGPAWDMLRSVSINTMGMFLRAAEQGEYATRDVIRAMTMFLQGGALGWRGSEGCITPTSDEFAHDHFVRFEDLLLARWDAAVEAGNNADIRAIAYAAVQFGLPRLLAATQGGS